jgi:uncharacterized membrane protein
VTSTTTFTVHVLGSASDAEQALRVAESLHDRGPLGIDDIAAATWPPGDHRPTAWQEPTLGQQPLSGAFWGLFFGIALLLPLCGTHRPQGLLDAVGLNDELLDLVTGLVVPGTSALFLLSAAPPVGRLGDVLTRRANDTTTAVLDAARLRHAFGTDGDSPQI